MVIEIHGIIFPAAPVKNWIIFGFDGSRSQCHTAPFLFYLRYSTLLIFQTERRSHVVRTNESNNKSTLFYYFCASLSELRQSRENYRRYLFCCRRQQFLLFSFLRIFLCACGACDNKWVILYGVSVKSWLLFKITFFRRCPKT